MGQIEQGQMRPGQRGQDLEHGSARGLEGELAPASALPEQRAAAQAPAWIPTTGPWDHSHARDFNPAHVPVVRLIGYPVALGLQLDRHTQSLLREITLMALDCQSQGTEPPPPVRLYQELMNLHIVELMQQNLRQRQDAHAQGKISVDLDYPTTPHALSLITYVWDCIDQLNEFAKSGQLLSVGMSPQMQEVVTWVRHEMFTQLEGEPPIPWAQYHAENMASSTS